MIFKFKEKLDKLYKSDWYFILLAVLTVITWQFKLNIIGMGVIVLLGSFSLFYRRDISPFLATIFFVVFATSDIFRNKFEEPIFRIICGIFCIYMTVGIIIFLIRNFLKNNEEFHFGKLWSGMLIAGISVIISGLFYKENALNIKNLPNTFAISIGIYFIYLLIINGIVGDNVKQICKIILYATFVVCAEIVCFYIKDYKNFFDNLFLINIDLGWARSNSISQYLVMSIPIVMYLAINSKKTYVYLSISVFISLLICVIGSRSALVGLVIMYPISFFVAFKYSKIKKPYIIISIILFIICLLVVILLFDKILNFFEISMEQGATGRTSLYSMALNMFGKSPWLGIGYYGDDWYFKDYGSFPFSGDVWKWHSTPLQILTCGGIVGCICFVPFYYQRYKLFFGKSSLFKVFALLYIICFELFGLLDLTFITVYQILFVFLILSEVEKENNRLNLEKI